MPVDLITLRQRVEKDPHNLLFRFSLGQALLNEKELEEAAEAFARCREAREDWMVPRIMLGKTLLDLNRPGEARPVLQEALALAIEQKHEDPEREVRELLAEIG